MSRPSTWPRLHWHCYHGDLEAVKECLEQGDACDATMMQSDTASGSNVVARRGISALYLAAQNGHKGVCRVLIQAGADPALPMVNLQIKKNKKIKFTPDSVAFWHMHFGLSMYLRKARKERVKKKKKESTPAEALLANSDADEMGVASISPRVIREAATVTIAA